MNYEHVYILNIIILQISLGPGFPKEKDIILEVEIIDIQSLSLIHI